MRRVPKAYRHREIRGQKLRPETLMMSYGMTRSSPKAR